MTIIGESGEWGRIVKIGDSYYGINDWGPKKEMYHAFAIWLVNKAWLKAEIQARFLIYPEKNGVKDVVEKDTTDFGKSFSGMVESPGIMYPQ